MARVTQWRASLVSIALLLVGAIIVVSAERSSAEATPLPSADTIVLELEPGNTRAVYGASTQVFSPDPTSCNVGTSGDMIFDISTTATNKKGDVVEGKLGLVDDGLGSDLRGNGNAQDCGRVGTGESLTLMLSTPELAGKAIEEVDWHFEGKFDAEVAVTYHAVGSEDFTEHYDLSESGSDSGPDAKLGDDYRVDSAPRESDNAGKLFTGVTITAVTGEVSVKGGEWPEPEIDRTVFHLVSALDCGDATTEGGPNLADDPLAAFYVGPSTKVDPPCGIPVEITTENNTTLNEQVVNVGPPLGLTWDGLGVTGVVTIEWDIEDVDLDPVDRTFVRVPGKGDVVIPWCADDVGISLASGAFYYELNPFIAYPIATSTVVTFPDLSTGLLDTCLIDQSTETVEFDDDNNAGTPPLIRTQTTEVFYIYNDPAFVRK